MSDSPSTQKPVIRLYNTASRRKEEFVPQNPPAVTMYNCGPTVYDFFHVGNARNFVVVDAIRRHLEYRGYKVKFAQNFTDIDDKIIKRANERGENWKQLASRFTDAYYKSADAIGVQRAQIHPCATDHIPQMIDLVKKLEERGLAYAVAGGDVYYRVRKFEGYGALSGKDIDDLEEGARVEVGDAKEDPLDFALWKGAKPGEPSWPSPWGEGRPGWHIECSAMAMHHLGETVDIHSGGVDLVFPHHENERAQSCGATGKPFARYWLHNGFLTIDNEKMAKSTGNFFTIDQVLEKYAPAVVRFLLLSAHYRSPLEYSTQALEQSKAAIGRIKDALNSASAVLSAGGPVSATPTGDFDTASRREEQDRDLAAYSNDFDRAMDDDFNSQGAIGVLFRAVSRLHTLRNPLAQGVGSALDRYSLQQTIEWIRQHLDRLGLLALIESDAAASEKGTGGDQAFTSKLLDLLVSTRAAAKKAKQFQLADQIRDELAALGIRLQDSPTGTIWVKD